MNAPTQPRVVAGITTRNRVEMLPQALDSLRATRHPGLLIKVVDDGSTDATPNLRLRYPEAEWLRHEQPLGIIESRNELMRTAAAEYFLCLDDDAWFLEGDELGRAVARLEQDPAIAGIAFDILSADRPERAPRSAPRRVSMYIGCGHLLRLSAVKSVGYYAPAPGTYGSEEKDLSLRLADRGWRIELLPGVHVWHAKAWSNRDNRTIHRSGVCNELTMTLRRCPWPDLLLVLPWKLVRYLWFWFRHPFYFGSGLAAWGDFLRHAAVAWRTRQPVQRSTFWRFHRSAG